MKVQAQQLKPLFARAAQEAFPELSYDALLEMVSVEEPRDAAHGDFACPLPFRLAKELGKSPAEIGQAMVEAFPEDGRVGSVEFALPGFVNLRLASSYLEEVLKELESGVNMEHGETRTRPVIVEYSSTNAAKPMAVHHLITTILGDALANLFQFMGYEVIRINHLGDWGTVFGKIIYAVETWGDKTAIERNPNEELQKLYVRFNTEAEKDASLDDEARKIFEQLEKGDELREAMWEWIVAMSLRDLEKQLDTLGVHFDHITGESFYRGMTGEILKEGEEKGVFVEGEGGSLIFDMGEDQVPALVRKGDGATLYLTRDVAAVKYRVETWHPESILYVVDHAQSLHFKQDFAISRALGYEGDSQLEHVSFGRMSFADMAMSTRKGNVLSMDKLLAEATRRAGELSAERGTELPRAEFAEIAKLIGVSSVKYSILAQDRVKDLLFDWDKVISLEGNSAPYLLYSYARAHSIFEKAGRVVLEGLPELTEESELALMRRMVKFGDILERALLERKPHVVAFYLFDLCQEFNRFYGHTTVLKAEGKALRTRLGLVQAFMHVMKSGLGILGIPVLEKM